MRESEDAQSGNQSSVLQSPLVGPAGWLPPRSEEPASPLQLGFAWLQLQGLQLHGKPHVSSNLQFALEERLPNQMG